MQPRGTISSVSRSFVPMSSVSNWASDCCGRFVTLALGRTLYPNGERRPESTTLKILFRIWPDLPIVTKNDLRTRFPADGNWATFQDSRSGELHRWVHR